MTEYTEDATLAEEQQLEVHGPVPVVIAGPVHVQQLPPVMSVVREVTVLANMGAAVVVANHDINRKRLRVFAPTTATPALFNLAFTKTDAEGSIGTWLQNEPWEHFGEEQVWATNPNGTDMQLTVLEEFYTR